MIPGPPCIIRCTTRILYISYDALVHIITKRTALFSYKGFLLVHR